MDDARAVTTGDDPVIRLGTYPAAGASAAAGRGEGLWELSVRDGALVDARQVLESPAPSFLAVHPRLRVGYAVGETAPGTVSAFRLAPAGGPATELARVPSGGDHPCHLLVDPAGRALYVANYGTGTLAVVPLGADGAPAAQAPVQVFAASGRGPDPQRQEGPHAHSATLAPGGRWVLVADLGTDELRRYRVVDDGMLEPDGVAARLEPGTGPRHVAAAPDGRLYVTGELTSTVHVLDWDDASGTARPVEAVPACAAPPVSDARSYPSHLVLDGDRLWVAVRGADVVATFAVGARLRHLADTPTGGAWPRHFARVGEALVVANERSGTLARLPLDADRVPAAARTGSAPLRVPSPACVVLDG